MAPQQQAEAVGDKRVHLSEQEKHERKQRVLTQGQPSVVRSIADAVVVKYEDIFFLAQPNGQVPLDAAHGYGLYYHDCRFLNGYELKIAGAHPNALVSNASRGFSAVYQLTNPDIRMANGELIPKEHLGIRWERIVDNDTLALHEVIALENFGLERAEFPLTLTYRGQFEPLFAVRGLLEEHPGKVFPPKWKDDILFFHYDGADGLYRSLSVHFSPRPARTEDCTACFDITLKPGETKQILISLVVAESASQSEIQPRQRGAPDPTHLKKSEEQIADEWLSHQTTVTSDSVLLNRIVERSLLDLRMLRTTVAGHQFFAAGIPWFGTLFGRDSIITALQTLAYEPHIAEQTLRVLASMQGHQVDPWRDEQPGKILHEFRVGELARMGEIPYNPPYYGTIDATPLFLILLERHAAWTGRLELLNELRSNVEAALEWIEKYGDQDDDGYVEYESTSEKGLINQGWKDSGNAIVNADGSLATPPIELVEVQGYVYRARLAMASLFDRIGEGDRAARLRKKAETLREMFDRDFWLKDKQFYALALQQDNRPCAVISSNPGHALWTGIVDEEKASRVMRRLMADDMFNGWGIRTLSETERRYNPIGYHLGTVWPHDNAIIAAGFRRYGFDDAALKLFTSIVEAAMHFDYYRLPEVFAGFPRQEYHVPVHYPVACHPQAWAAGSVPFLIQALLGLEPEGFERRLRIVRPLLPHFVDHLSVHGLRIADATIDLRFARTGRAVAVEILKLEGELDVLVEPTK